MVPPLTSLYTDEKTYLCPSSTSTGNEIFGVYSRCVSGEACRLRHQKSPWFYSESGEGKEVIVEVPSTDVGRSNDLGGEG